MARSFSSIIFLTIFPAAAIAALAIGPIPSPQPTIKPPTPTTHIQYFGSTIAKNETTLAMNYPETIAILGDA